MSTTDSKPLRIVTSRTAMVAYRSCPRLRLLNYHYQGNGMESIRKSTHLVVGIAVHDALAGIWEGKDPSDLIKAGKETITQGVPPDRRDEQCALFEGIVWAWIRVRYPALSREFEPVAVEHELLWKMGEKQGVEVYDQIRCDALLRRRSDGGLFYWEIKTSGDPGEAWIRSWEHNSQLLINTIALEELLGERIQGVLIEGLVKGRLAPDRLRTSPWFGEIIQQSPFCYIYVEPTTKAISLKWEKGWRKIATWTHLPIQRLVMEVMTEEDCNALFVPVPPIRPTNANLLRHKEQCLWQESDIALGLEACKADLSMLDRYFPLNDDHCHRYWNYPCSFLPVCYDSEIARDPVGSGLFQPRVPHHPTGE